MSHTFEKITVKKWEVTAVYKNFMKKELMPEVVQRKVVKCEICNAKFSGDYIHLAFVKGRVNHMICDTCCKTCEDKGVHIKLKKDEPEPEPEFS